jgi:tRNA threonylcarbamoyladenosine biosynthesis protein TsaB
VTVLAIDTSGEYGSLVLLDRGGRIEEPVLHSPDGHSTRLFGELETLLHRARATLEDIDCFAAAAGPGSFTGVRVALSAAKGLALAMGKPMVAISNLRALAWFGESPLRAVVADARRGDVFTAVYTAALDPVQPEMVISDLDSWLGSVSAAGVEIITADPRLLAHCNLPAPLRLATSGELGRAVAHIAQRSVPVDPALTDANYVRRADAELRWVDR